MLIKIVDAFVIVKQDIGIQDEDLAIFFRGSRHISPLFTLTLYPARIELGTTVSATKNRIFWSF
jgi:hypothetical protein